jgi:hypothetical protein
VIVYPGSGGEFYKGNTCDVVDPDNEIDNVAINPSLVFQFKLGNTQKLTITTKTQCNLGKSELEHYDGNYLGYY